MREVIKGQWVIHTKSGGRIVNVETKRKIPFRRVGNSYFMDARVRVPDRNKDKDKAVRFSLSWLYTV